MISVSEADAFLSELKEAVIRYNRYEVQLIFNMYGVRLWGDHKTISENVNEIIAQLFPPYVKGCFYVQPELHRHFLIMMEVVRKYECGLSILPSDIYLDKHKCPMYFGATAVSRELFPVEVSDEVSN